MGASADQLFDLRRELDTLKEEYEALRKRYVTEHRDTGDEIDRYIDLVTSGTPGGVDGLHRLANMLRAIAEGYARVGEQS